MTKSLNSKINYAQRREQRLRRDKFAGQFLAAIINHLPDPDDQLREHLRQRAAVARIAADILLAELERTKPVTDD